MYKTEKRTIILIRNVVPFSEIAHKKIEPYFSIVYEVLYMVAIQGVYENGHIQLEKAAPMEKANVIVIFPEHNAMKNEQSDQISRKLFEEFTGSIARAIGEKEELNTARNEKYANID